MRAREILGEDTLSVYGILEAYLTVSTDPLPRRSVTPTIRSALAPIVTLLPTSEMRCSCAYLSPRGHYFPTVCQPAMHTGPRPRNNAWRAHRS